MSHLSTNTKINDPILSQWHKLASDSRTLTEIALRECDKKISEIANSPESPIPDVTASLILHEYLCAHNELDLMKSAFDACIRSRTTGQAVVHVDIGLAHGGRAGRHLTQVYALLQS